MRVRKWQETRYGWERVGNNVPGAVWAGQEMAVCVIDLAISRPRIQVFTAYDTGIIEMPDALLYGHNYRRDRKPVADLQFCKDWCDGVLVAIGDVEFEDGYDYSSHVLTLSILMDVRRAQIGREEGENKPSTPQTPDA